MDERGDRRTRREGTAGRQTGGGPGGDSQPRQADSAISHVTVLTNPKSGHGNAPHAGERAVTRLQELGINVTGIVGRDAAHARELVDDALTRETDALVVVG